MPQKVVYIIQSLAIGGAEVALLSALPILNAEFDFKLICLKKIDSNFIKNLSEKEKESIVTFDGVPLNYIRGLIYILRFKPDILISSLWKASVLAIPVKLLRKKTKFIKFIHSSTFFHFLDKLFCILALKLSDIVFCDSTSSKDFIKKHIGNKPVEIISFLRFKSPNKLTQKTEIRTKGFFVGRFHEAKRIDRLVNLVKELDKQGLDFQIDLYGRDDGTMKKITALISDNNLEKHFILKGEICSSEIKTLFEKYDFYFQTSEIEGMAMSVVEAMQHGLVCVVTNVGEIKNYAKDGFNAIVIDYPFEKNINKATLQVKKASEDLNFYLSLSKNAFFQFADKAEFSISLVNTIKKNL